MRILLAGQPNCGKTTLFNRLTGRQEHTGNRAGVTVHCARGRLRGRGEELVDLPGLYSFTGGGPDEETARRAIQNEAPDLILNVVDSTALVRGLALTLQLIALRRPMAVLLNMADEAREQGIRIDTGKLASRLGVPVYAISARTGEGLDDLDRFIRESRTSRMDVPSAQEALFRSARAIGEAVMTRPFSAKRKGADRLLLHPFWGLPIFALSLGLVFLIAFQWVGPYLGQGIEWGKDRLKEALTGSAADRRAT